MWISYSLRNLMQFIFTFVCMYTGAREEEEGEGPGCIWEEEAAEQTEGQSWESCRGEVRFSIGYPCPC